jgi:hypothetical protein
MCFAWLALLGLLVVGCASPSPTKKPSPYRYPHTAPLHALGAHRKEPL